MVVITERKGIPAPPGPDAILWRYMSLTKLLWIVSERRLPFTRADLMAGDDPFEGSLTPLTKGLFREEVAKKDGFFTGMTDFQIEDGRGEHGKPRQ